MSILYFDIETVPSEDYELYKPTFKEPRINKDGSYNKTDKSLETQEEEWKSKLALSPFTGQVMLIGHRTDDGGWNSAHQNNNVSEKYLLNHFWGLYNKARTIVGFNIKTFDLPFLIRRSWKYGTNVPYGILNARGYFEDKVVDIREILNCGVKQQYDKDSKLTSGSLSNFSKFFGLKLKDDEASANFFDVWNNDKERAIAANKIEVENIQTIHNIIKNNLNLNLG